MKLTRTDKKLAALGFHKLEENEYGADFLKNVEIDNLKYKHKVSIRHKSSGQHILQSYDPDLSDVNNIGCVCVGLTYTELRLFLKKMRKLRLY